MLGFINEHKLAIITAVAGVVTAVSAVVFGPLTDSAVDTVSSVTPAQAAQFKARGDNVLITAASVWSPCGRAPYLNTGAYGNSRIAVNEGLYAAEYFLASPFESGRSAVDRVYSVRKDDWDILIFMALDYEIPEGCPPVSYQFILDAVDRLEELGKPRVIYTSYYNWVNVLGNPPWPADTYLWNANWDNDCTDVDWLRLPFGPDSIEWVLAEQCTGGTYVAGVNVDNNIIRTFTTVATPTPTATPTATPTPAPTIKPPAFCCGKDYNGDGRADGYWNREDEVWEWECVTVRQYDPKAPDLGWHTKEFCKE